MRQTKIAPKMVKDLYIYNIYAMNIHALHVFNRHKNGKTDAIATKHLLLMYKIHQLFSFPL